MSERACAQEKSCAPFFRFFRSRRVHAIVTFGVAEVKLVRGRAAFSIGVNIANRSANDEPTGENHFLDRAQVRYRFGFPAVVIRERGRQSGHFSMGMGRPQ